MNRTQAVIFDVDGVLVDSYDAHLQSWLAVTHAEGIAFTEADFASTFGWTSREIVRRFWKIEDPQRIRDIDHRKETRYRELVQRGFPEMDGARELIDALLAAGFALAMGSSGPPENLQLALNGLMRHNAFSAVVSGEDVRRGKPDPEVFTLAAQRLHIPPQRCVVIEDAPAGVQAALAAGIKCIALLSRGRARNDFHDALPHVFVQSLRELSPASIQRLLMVER